MHHPIMRTNGFCDRIICTQCFKTLHDSLCVIHRLCDILENIYKQPMFFDVACI